MKLKLGHPFESPRHLPHFVTSLTTMKVSEFAMANGILCDRYREVPVKEILISANVRHFPRIMHARRHITQLAAWRDLLITDYEGKRNLNP